MITIRLYDENSEISSFKAKVVSCAESDGQYKVILDKTAFFPEAGGQPCDTGEIDGVKVLSVQIEDKKIVHYTEKFVETGKLVSGEINYKRRFAFMQNHSAEHIISGIVHRKYGFENVGFHLNEEVVTLDFDGLLDNEQIDEIEYLSNKTVWENKKITAYYPEKEQLKSIDFRQKKEIEGDIRLVEIEDTDICACCAPHVKFTGQIGLIKILGQEKMRGGTRLYMKSGEYALKDYNNKYCNISAIGNLLSVKPGETADAVKSIVSKLENEKTEKGKLKEKIIDILANADKDTAVIFAENTEMKDLQSLADKRYRLSGNLRLVLSLNNDNEYSFVLCGNEEEIKAVFEKMKSLFGAKGGGRNGMISGKIKALKEDILKEFS